MSNIFPRTWITASGETRTAHRVTYTVAGKKKFRQFKTVSAARAFTRRLESVIHLETAEHKNTRLPTVAQYADVWLAACKNGRLGEEPLEPETIKTYSGYVENWIKPHDISELRVGAVKRKDVVSFRAHLLEACATRITARKILTALRSIFGYALDTETIDHDPTNKITIKLGRRQQTTVQIHSKADMGKMIELARALAATEDKRTAKAWQRYSLMLELLVYCGLRLSELRGLPRSALDFRLARLTVKQRADRSGRIGPPKSVRGRRNLYMPDTLAARLEVWLQTHRQALMFPSASGEPLFPENIHKRMWAYIQTAAGVPTFNIHSARHFFASRLIEDGANVKELSTDLGHADVAFTIQVYGHLFRDPESEARRRQRANTLQLRASD